MKKSNTTPHSLAAAKELPSSIEGVVPYFLNKVSNAQSLVAKEYYSLVAETCSQNSEQLLKTFQEFQRVRKLHNL